MIQGFKTVHTMTRSFRFFILSLVVLLAANASAQTRSALPDSVIEQRLVELAWNGPEVQTTEHRSKVYEYQLKNAKNQWMNLLTFSLNYNDQTLKQTTPTTSDIYPKYFFGLNIPLGTLLSRTPVKAANEGIEIGKLDQEQVKRKLRADVLTKYREYKAQSELVDLSTASINDIEATLDDVKLKFQKNEVTFEALNQVQQTRNSERAKIINLKLQQEVIKLEIERIIGTSLESVLK